MQPRDQHNALSLFESGAIQIVQHNTYIHTHVCIYVVGAKEIRKGDLEIEWKSKDMIEIIIEISLDLWLIAWLLWISGFRVPRAVWLMIMIMMVVVVVVIVAVVVIIIEILQMIGIIIIIAISYKYVNEEY